LGNVGQSKVPDKAKRKTGKSTRKRREQNRRKDRTKKSRGKR
jgi:hypothetical protein